jgi:hypothetical protein
MTNQNTAKARHGRNIQPLNPVGIFVLGTWTAPGDQLSQSPWVGDLQSDGTITPKASHACHQEQEDDPCVPGVRGLIDNYSGI